MPALPYHIHCDAKVLSMEATAVKPRIKMVLKVLPEEVPVLKAQLIITEEYITILLPVIIYPETHCIIPIRMFHGL